MTLRAKVLPNTSAKLFLTDGGLETTLVFLEGYDLPHFAAFDLLKDEEGFEAIRNYYRRYLAIARDYGAGFILESPTWRASPDWIKKLGYPEADLFTLNKRAIQLLVELKEEYENFVPDIVLSGCVGPRGDGYIPGTSMTADEAQEYHSAQINVFSETAVDMISAITMNYAEEAIGIARAAAAHDLPVVISFTVETNGRLPTGMRLKEAIELVDKNTLQPPIYYMLNCAHPSHFSEELKTGKNEHWVNRIRGLRANASCKSHAELDEATALDRGNPEEFAGEHRRLREAFQQLNVFGGCCGTDEEHVLAIAKELSNA
ncbi:homocysteine S-methyltransferase [Segetibacter sp. 3557_3]|uniref:homocysteine S-methyltransferase family protein n=1 Tax=Segetibacter sp. 3557_3 TaxID=2547429 RepID=UPI001058605D|nr:homocysteine S-methyltransferase family protein [Segetibacter sp. 3557_3]TDH27278.1 homocysteine S-methyltransferase [Segetibacter sp. 3557_3]